MACYDCSGCGNYCFLQSGCKNKDCDSIYPPSSEALRPSPGKFKHVKYMKTGFHIRFDRRHGPFIDPTTHAALQILVQKRAKSISNLLKFDFVSNKTDWKKIVDLSVVKNGLRVIGTRKYERCNNGRPSKNKSTNKDHSRCCGGSGYAKIRVDSRPEYGIIRSFDLNGRVYNGVIDSWIDMNKIVNFYGIRCEENVEESEKSTEIKQYLKKHKNSLHSELKLNGNSSVSSSSSGSESKRSIKKKIKLQSSEEKNITSILRKMAPQYEDISIKSVTLMTDGKKKGGFIAINVNGANTTFCPIQKRNHGSSKVWFLLSPTFIMAKCFSTKHGCNKKKSGLIIKGDFKSIFKNNGVTLTGQLSKRKKNKKRRRLDSISMDPKYKTGVARWNKIIMESISYNK